MRQSQAKVPRNSLREKILDVAEHLFAEKGFVETSIREITKRANCNLSAVNYYFHGKGNLYIEVFRRDMRKVGCQDTLNISTVLSKIGGQVTLEQLVRTFCKAFVQPFFKNGNNKTLMKLVMKEQQEPHLPKHSFAEQLVLPAKSGMKEALVQACPGLEDSAADLCVQSIIGQLHHLMQTQALDERPNHKNMPITDLPECIEHIVRFSAAGVRQYVNAKATLSAKR